MERLPSGEYRAIQYFEHERDSARERKHQRDLRAYQVGAFRITELLDEQRRLIEAQREYTEALTERYRANADLQVALGFTINVMKKRSSSKRNNYVRQALKHFLLAAGHAYSSGGIGGECDRPALYVLLGGADKAG